MTNFGDMVIYDIHGSKLMDAILTEGAVLERELGKTDVVKLSWKSDKKSTLPVGSYIVPFSDGLKYRLLDDYTPLEDSTSVKYEPVFNHPLAVLSRIPFLYDTTDQDGNPIKQQEWPYDGLTTNALEYACKAINEALGITDESKKFTYTLCGTVDTTISFSVSSNDILSVLSSMAQACKNNSSEWHLSWEDHTLYFGQIFINLGEKVPLLKVHDNINFASVNSSNEPYYNCFYPQGSSRNMSRKAQVGLGNVATLVRLGLNKNKFPDGCIYVDKDSNVITKDAFVQSGAVKQMVALSFDDVYPHIDLYAYNVRPRYRYLKNRQTNEIEKDANGKNKVYTTWYMRLAYPTTVKDGTKTLVNTTNDIDEHGKQVTHYWYDYELNVKEQVLQGHTLKATFKVNTHATDGKYDALAQSLVGQPNGQDGFELAYFDKNNAKEIPSNHYDGDSGVNIKAGDYEIKFYQSEDIIIPTNIEEGLYPRGNNLPDLTCNIVVLFNIKQGQQEIASAQDELAKRTEEEIERRFKDNNNYTFSSNPVAFEEKNPKLHIGQKVIFNDGQGYELSTRIIKIESKIDFPFIQSITVGNQAVKGAITQLKEDVKSILSGNFSGGGGLNASQIETVIKNYTLPRFLRKDIADTAKEVITFLKGIIVKSVSYFVGIVNRGDISNTGDIHNTGDITNAGDITTKNLTVTDKATFFELEILKAKAAGGIIIQSAATFKVDDYEETDDGYACYQLAEKDGKVLRQMCRKGDQMLCHGGLNMTAASPDPSQGGGTGTPTANHYYWRLVTDAPTQTETCVIGGKERKCLKIVLSKTDFATGSDKPQVGDELAQVGNRVDADRQCVNISSAYNSLDEGLLAPYWAKYVGVDDFQLENHRETFLARNDNQIVGRLLVKGSSGELKPVPALLGEWKSGKEYGYYDSVTHDGRQWLCVAVRGTKTTEEPGKGDAWMLLVDKGKNGQDGRTSYFHVKYADVASPTSSSQMNDTSGDYMGTYVDFTQADSDDPRRYTWVRTKGAQGADGTQGVPGKNGADGRTSYLHIKYSNDGGGTFTSNGGEDAGDYIGQYVDFNMRDSGNPRDYKWALVKGKDGRDGRDGVDGRDGRNGENGADGTDGKDGENGKDSVSYALVPLEEKVVAYLTDDKGKWVDVELMYKVRKSVGERVSFVTDLAAEGMTLEVSGALGDFGADGERFFIQESVLYEDNYDSYAVTLTKGGNVVDRRVLPITFKPKVVFDIDTKNGEIRRDITNVKGDMNSFKETINDTSNTVGNLSKEFTQMKQTSKEISMTVNNGTRPNLLWGSDLDLSGVQDVINRAYAQGDIIKKKTEEKAEWKRSRDNAGSDDDRMRYQEGMDDCDREIAQAQGEVAKCKEAIGKRLGVGLNATRVESKEWFEYLKGGGVGGADAIKAKVAVVNGEGNYYAGLYWQIGFGAKSNVKVKPKTKYTFSFWIRTEILQGSGYAVAESINMESLTGGRKDRAMPWTKVPAKNEWERMSYTFTTGATGYIMVGVGLSGEDNFSGLIYLCHPKLEEGDTATPWCAYDGTVDALLATGLDIKNRRMVFTTDNFVIRNNKGEVTVGIDRNGMMEFYGKDKEFPGIRFGVNEQGEMVLEFWRRGVKLYDLGPDNVFNKLDNVKSVFTPMHLTRVKIYNNSSGERCVRTDILYDQYDNPEGLPVFRFSEGYKLIGGARRYNISGTETPSGYDGKYFFGSVKKDLSFALFGDMMNSLKYAHGTFVSVDDAAKIDRMSRSPIKQVPNTTIEVVKLTLGFKSSSVETIGGGNGEVTIADDKPTVDIPGLPPGWKPPHFEH